MVTKRKGVKVIKTILYYIGGGILAIAFMFFLWVSIWFLCALDDHCYEQNTNPSYYIERNMYD